MAKPTPSLFHLGWQAFRGKNYWENNFLTPCTIEMTLSKITASEPVLCHALHKKENGLK